MDHKDDLGSDLEQESADRGMPAISPKGVGSGIGRKILIGTIAVMTILALIAVNGGFSSKGKDDEKVSGKTKERKEIANHLGPAPEPPQPKAPPALQEEKIIGPNTIDTGNIVPTATAGEKGITPEERKRAGGVLMTVKKTATSGANVNAESYAADSAQMAAMAAANATNLLRKDQADGLGVKLKSTQVDGTRASVLTCPSLFITRGTFLDCALETAISSDQPGMTSCRLTSDIYSTNGKVLLLERGSRITGQYQGGLKRGQARIFVLWNRVETPHGVIVNLDSPGTDSLGRSGHAGYIDTHFWDRFGAAIMFSLLDDAGNVVSNLAKSGSGNNISFDTSASAATEMLKSELQNSINIPPTLRKNQGEHINVFVARDIDFRGVYELKTSTRTR
ncbi:MAG: type IV secretion system protein VirB10 [Geobacteraceae bacterium]|nr:type IV secretion system protein VirB10 [Geobacteraceae bacterium]